MAPFAIPKGYYVLQILQLPFLKSIFASFVHTGGDESRRPIILASSMWRSIQCRLAPSNAHSYLTQYVLLVSFSHYLQYCIAKCCQLVKRTHKHYKYTHLVFSIQNSTKWSTSLHTTYFYRFSQQLLTTAKNDNEDSALSFYEHELRMRFRSDAANEPYMVIVFSNT